MFDKTKVGYIAVEKYSRKGLSIQFGGPGYQNKCHLTNDIDRIFISKDKNTLEMYTGWYNRQHKNLMEFDIIEIKFSKTMEEIKDENV